MVQDNYLRTYGDLSVVEDVVMGLVEIISATEDNIQKRLGHTKAIAMIHDFEIDTLQAPGSLAVTEGGDYPMSARTTPSRLTNFVQIMVQSFAVTNTQQQVHHYHQQNEKARQLNKAVEEWSNGFEYDLVRGVKTSGISGVAPTMSGIIEATSKASNHTTHTSGIAYTATIQDALMADNYTNSNGDVATDIYVGAKLRQVIDTFITKTNQLATSTKGVETITKTVTTYETSFGTVNFHTHRYIQQDADTTGRVLAINPNKLKIAWLQKPFVDTGLARAGDYEKRAVVGKATLEVHNQDSNWYADGFNID